MGLQQEVYNRCTIKPYRPETCLWKTNAGMCCQNISLKPINKNPAAASQRCSIFENLAVMSE